jgi:AcrR family transcriptional regulator
VAKNSTGAPKRPYELGKRLEAMDQTRATVLRAAREQLESRGYRQMTMGSLAVDSGITRQTIHNLFGTKSAVLEALFDVIALDGGMERMREVMTQPSPEAMLQGFVEVFCGFWASNRLLIRRIHGIGAIDPEFGAVIQARNRRRFTAALRVTGKIAEKTGSHRNAQERAASLTALTSFEFFDALAENLPGEERAVGIVLEMAHKLFGISLK